VTDVVTSVPGELKYLAPVQAAVPRQSIEFRTFAFFA
jgi:hypothetical protein